MENEPIFDHREIKARLAYLGMSREKFGDEMGLTRVSIDNFIKGKTHWTDAQIAKAAKTLKISPKEITKFFFCVND